MRILSPFLSLIVVLAGILAFDTPSHAAWLWSPETGKWTNTKDVPRDSPDAQFSSGKVQFDQDKFNRAVTEFSKVIKHYPNSRWAAEAQYYKGLSYEKMGDIGKASDSFKLLVDRYPYSERLGDAIEHEFDLAEAMYQGKKTKFWGFEIMPAQDTAAVMYRHIVRSAPYGPYGAVSQYRVGDAELSLGNFDEAERAYQAVIDEYPNSEYAPKAKYKIAQVSYTSALTEEYRQERTDDALTKFEGFKRAHPDSYLQFEADDAIARLREKKAADTLDIALFYEERGRYPSAKIYYEDIVRSFPETKVAPIAKERLSVVKGIISGDAQAPNRFLGMFRLSKEDRSVQEEREGKVRRKILGIPMGWKDKKEEVEEVPVPEGYVRQKKSFMGIPTKGYKDVPIEETLEGPAPEGYVRQPKSFLGIPTGFKDVPTEETIEAQAAKGYVRKRKTFMGILPTGKFEDVPIEETAEAPVAEGYVRQPQSILGIPTGYKDVPIEATIEEVVEETPVPEGYVREPQSFLGFPTGYKDVPIEETIEEVVEETPVPEGYVREPQSFLGIPTGYKDVPIKETVQEVVEEVITESTEPTTDESQPSWG